MSSWTGGDVFDFRGVLFPWAVAEAQLIDQQLTRAQAVGMDRSTVLSEALTRPGPVADEVHYLVDRYLTKTMKDPRER